MSLDWLPTVESDWEKVMWVDGTVVPYSAFQLDPEDEGLLFGRGAFTTTRTLGGQPWLWAQHLERLRHTASWLGIAVAAVCWPSATQLRQFVERLAGHRDVVLRVNVSAGTASGQPRCWVVPRPLPTPRHGIVLKLSDWQVALPDRWCEHKTFNYGRYQQAWRLAQHQGADDALLTSTNGQLLETTRANLFVQLDGEWYTPPLQGILPGVVRSVLLYQAELPIVETPLPVGFVEDFTAAVVTNSARGVEWVRQLGEHRLTHPQAMLENIQAVFAQTQPSGAE